MNTIAIRISDFLKDFPPFNMLSKVQLFAVSEAVDVIYLERDKFLFQIGTSVEDHFYVVRNGAIGLIREDGSLVDECDEGDIFGLRALLRKGDYVLNARATEESIVYSISSKLLENYITTNTEAKQYLLASFVSNARFKDHDYPPDKIADDLAEVQSAENSKNPITCTKQNSIKEAALTMTEKHVGSIVITKAKRPIGIITDKDLRTKIATGKFKITDTVTSIMSSPVITYPESITVAEAQLAMLKNRITHLCITRDGTINSE